MFWSRDRDRLRQLEERMIVTKAIVSRIETLATNIEKNQTKLWRMIVASFEDQIGELDELTNVIADRFENYEKVNAELRAAVLNGDADKAAALAQQSEQHAAALGKANDRLRDLGKDPQNPVPSEPLPPVLEPDQPDTSGDAPVQGVPGDPADLPISEPTPDPVVDPPVEQTEQSGPFPQ